MNLERGRGDPGSGWSLNLSRRVSQLSLQFELLRLQSVPPAAQVICFSSGQSPFDSVRASVEFFGSSI